jgi:hypothetical protein
MITKNTLDSQLRRAGTGYGWLCRPAKNELIRILRHDEQVVRCVSGRYKGGFAILVATNLRLLLVDKKLFFLRYEDICFSSITEVDFSRRLVESTLDIHSMNGHLQFNSTNAADLRYLATTVEAEVMRKRYAVA